MKNLDIIFFAVRCYFNAFVSSARSVTFAIQSTISDLPDFENWYAGWQKNLVSDKVAKFFLKSRNFTQKIGISNLNTGTFYKNTEGKSEIKYYFTPTKEIKEVPDIDLVSACNYHFVFLLEMIFDCFKNYGKYIDPEQYYTLENLKDNNKSIEDIEEELGFPRGWSSPIPDAERIRLLRRNAGSSGIENYFIEYLKKDKFGNHIDNK